MSARSYAIRSLSLLVAGSLSWACGKDSATGPKIGPPASLTIVSGDQQQGTVGTELSNPLVVKVVDANGNAIQGQTVNFRVTAGGGSVFAGSSTTNVDGVVQERWTLGTVAGTDQIVEARAVDNTTGQALVFATFHATALPDLAAALKLVRQPEATARSGQILTTQPTVQLLDKYGNAVSKSGVQVTVAVAEPANGHTLAGTTTATTDNTGLATFTNLALSGPVGSATLSFSATGLTPVNANAVTLAAGAPAQLSAVSALSVSGTVGALVTTLPRVIVKDAAGNPVPGVSVTFAVSTNGGTITPTSVTTDATGEAALSGWTLPKQPGTAMVLASVSEIPNVSVTFTATVSAGTASHIALVDNSALSGTVGVSIPLRLRVTDDFGNQVAGTTVTVAVGVNAGAISAAGGSAGATATATSDATGTVTFSWTLGPTAGQQTVTASLSGGPSVTVAATALAAAAAKLAVVTPPSSTAQSGQPLATQPVVRVTDVYGNAVAQSGVQVTATLANDNSGRTVSGNTVATDASGIATFASLTITGAAGTVALSFSAPNLTPVTSVAITLGAGTATQLKAVGPTTFIGTVGTALTTLPKVVVQDATGNPVSGVSVQFAVSTGGGTIAPTSVATDANGTASLSSWTLPTTPGSYSVVASVAGGGFLTFTATAQVAGASQIIAVSGNGASASTGATVTLVARVTDLYGNPVPGAIVNWSTVGNSGTLSAPSSVTDTSGKASIALTVSTTPTTAQVIASIQNGASVTFSISVSAQATRITSLIGTTDNASVGFTGSLPVQVFDDFNNPVAGVTVTWAIISGSGTLSATTGVTDASGRAQVSYTFPTQVMTSQIKESIPSGASVTIAARGIPLAPASITKVQGDGLTVPAGTAVSPSPVILVTDQYGNPVPNVPETFSVTAGGGSIGGGSVVTDSAGKATVGTWVLGTSPGTNTLKATAAGMSVTFTATGIVGPAAKLLIARQPSSSVVTGVPFPVQPIVQLADQFGNAVKQAGVSVTASSTVSAITLQNSSAVTDANGQATFSGLTATGPAGSFAVQFSSAGLQSRTSSTISLASAQPTTMAPANGVTAFNTTAGVALSAPYPAVLVTDAQRNPVAGVPVTFSFGGLNTIVNTGSDGVAQFAPPVLVGAGSYTITASATGLTGSPVTFTLTVGPGPLDHIQTSPPTYVAPITSFNYIAFAVDRYGNRVPGVTVNWSPLVGMGAVTFSPASSTTDALGQAKVTITGSGLIYFRASVPGTSIFADAGPLELGSVTTRTWVGGTAGAEQSWIYATNWSPAGVPTTYDAVVIPAVAYTPQLSRSVAIRNLSVASNAVLDLNGFDLSLDSSSAVVSVAGTIKVPGRVIAGVGTTAKINGATTLPNLLVSGYAAINVNGQTLTVTGDLTETNNYSTLSGGGKIVVYGSTYLTGNQINTALPALDLKGDLTTGTCNQTPCSVFNGGAFNVPLSLSGTAHQTVAVTDVRWLYSFGPITAAPGSDVTLEGGSSQPITIVGNLDLYGNFVIPAGTVVTVQGTLTLHSGSTTTVNGTLNAACVKDASGVTYTGFSCP